MSFDSELYYLENGKYLQVVDKPFGSIIDETKFYLSHNLIGRQTGGQVSVDPQVTSTDPNYNPTCFELTLEFTNLPVGGSVISFQPNLATKNGMAVRKALVLDLTLVKNEFGRYVPTFVINKNCKEWDGTQ